MPWYTCCSSTNTMMTPKALCETKLEILATAYNLLHQKKEINHFAEHSNRKIKKIVRDLFSTISTTMYSKQSIPSYQKIETMNAKRLNLLVTKITRLQQQLIDHGYVVVPPNHERTNLFNSVINLQEKLEEFVALYAEHQGNLIGSVRLSIREMIVSTDNKIAKLSIRINEFLIFGRFFVDILSDEEAQKLEQFIKNFPRQLENLTARMQPFMLDIRSPHSDFREDADHFSSPENLHPSNWFKVNNNADHLFSLAGTVIPGYHGGQISYEKFLPPVKVFDAFFAGIGAVYPNEDVVKVEKENKIKQLGNKKRLSLPDLAVEDIGFRLPPQKYTEPREAKDSSLYRIEDEDLIPPSSPSQVAFSEMEPPVSI